MHYRRKLIEFLMENSMLKIEPHTWSLLEISCIFEPILEHFRSILEIEGIFEAFWGLFWRHFWRESVWLFLSFRNRVANLVSISNLVINRQSCRLRDIFSNEVSWVSSCHFPLGTQGLTSRVMWYYLLLVEVFRFKRNCSKS